MSRKHHIGKYPAATKKCIVMVIIYAARLIQGERVIQGERIVCGTSPARKEVPFKVSDINLGLPPSGPIKIDLVRIIFGGNQNRESALSSETLKRETLSSLLLVSIGVRDTPPRHE